MKNKINFINRLRISITSISEYSKIIKESLSKAIIYSTILCTIIGSISGVISFIAFEKVQKNMKEILLSDEYEFKLENGILEFQNSPIKEEQGKYMIYINTNITLDSIEEIRKIVIHKDESLSLLKDGISYRMNGDQFNYKYSDLYFIEKIDNDTVLKSLDIIEIIKYIIFIIMILITYFRFIINVFVLSIIAVILNKFNGIRMTYKDIFKLCIYATTLSTIMSLILPIGNIAILISGIYFVLVRNTILNEKNI